MGKKKMSPFSTILSRSPSTKPKAHPQPSSLSNQQQQQHSRPFPSTPYLHTSSSRNGLNASKTSISSADNSVLPYDPYARYSLIHQSSFISLTEREARSNLDRQRVDSQTSDRTTKRSQSVHTHSHPQGATSHRHHHRLSPTHDTKMEKRVPPLNSVPSRHSLSRHSSTATHHTKHVISADTTDHQSPLPTSPSKSSHRDRQKSRVTHGIQEETEHQDKLHGLRNERSAGVLGSKDYRLNQSSTTINSRNKADKVLGLNPEGQLASLYLVSGLGKDPARWSRSDADTCRGIQPLEDSLGGGIFWRPDMLGNTFSGDREDRSRQESKLSGISDMTSPLRREVSGKALPDAGPEGASRLVAKTLKFAHPRDVEVVNSTLAPPTTCHAFSFTIPRHNTLEAVARTQTQAPMSMYDSPFNYTSMIDAPDELTSTQALPDHETRINVADLTFHGVTLTVWTHADKERSIKLTEIKLAMEKGLGSTRSNSTIRPSDVLKRKPMPRMSGNRVSIASEDSDVMSDSDAQKRERSRGLSSAPSVPSDAAAAYDEPGNIFWMPYAITLVSRHPIYDVLQDYLRLSWARYSKNAKAHMLQISRILNYETPRPGEVYRLHVSTRTDEEVIIEAVFPGALDFDKGLVQVDFQMWPLFQALDVEHIVACMEIALSNSGRVIFMSRHPAMLNIAVGTLKYIVELRGWNGIALPIIHARDSTFTVEDPGPYIIASAHLDAVSDNQGVSTECRYLLTPPNEVMMVDLDTKSPPVGVVTPREKRHKVVAKIIATLGTEYPKERSVPMEFKVSHPKGVFRNLNRFLHGPERPHYLGERLRSPKWWHQAEVISVFDKIMADKHKKPSLFSRLTRSGMNRQQAQLTVGEQLAKTMMRRRALHYVETRDDLELKIARINRRLLKLVEEGDHWKKQFETFEKYADRLAQEANELKVKIEREKREARRLSNVATEQTKANMELQDKLTKTEDARAEAMRQLSDMHHSIQELEREREEIMNIIEAQITEALDIEEEPAIQARADTPTDSILSSPRPKNPRSRPGTKDSHRSGLSRLTTDSQAISVIGAVNGRKNKAVSEKDPLAAVDRSILDKSDSIAERVALIQAKLEMALSQHRSANGSTSHLSESGTDRGDDEKEGNEDDEDEMASANPVSTSHQHSSEWTDVSTQSTLANEMEQQAKELHLQPSIETIHIEGGNEVKHSTKPLNQVQEQELIVEVAPNSPNEPVNAGDKELESQAIQASSNSLGLGLIRPDSGMRVRPKRRMYTATAGQGGEPHEDERTTLGGPAGKAEEILADDQDLDDGIRIGGAGTDSDTTPRKAKPTLTTSIVENRSSTYSTDTVTFGRAA